MQGPHKPGTKTVKPSDPSPGNWNMDTIQKLLTTVDVVEAPGSGKQPDDPAVDKEQAKDVCDACDAATRVSEPMKETLARLYDNDPAGKEVSLAWIDDDVEGPLSTLDTLEKVYA
jgi:hypothetical protein